MANIIYMTLRGDRQGLISSDCSTYDSIGNKYQRGHEDQILVLAVRHSISRSQNSHHHPLEIIKPIDKSSPLLGMAISNNETLDCQLDFFRTSQNGSQEKYYSITLQKASIKNITYDYPNSVSHNDRQPEEIILLDYRDITWKHLMASTSGYSIKEESIY
ncbi:Hcp family type VI secretion system effector [Providencia sp. Me31A]|uniref:Hcp family type VI secretion system effector n=1 Tax=Providencia sp. Me31A TaxID=3392637 RepID=UPI003D2C0613